MAQDLSAFKDEVKGRVDIADVVGEYIELKRRGTSLWGPCPFHAEKTPSFHVNAQEQYYHCFGCGKGGDVFTFLMDMTGMSFMEALEQVAARAGMTMPERVSYDKERKTDIDRIIQANLAAAEYFYHSLQTKAGKSALAYLQSRGLTPETIKAFRLGYSPNDPAELLDFTAGKGIDKSALDQAGIVMRSSYGGKPYNRFGDRVIFPIIDEQARILGFGGRLIEGEGAKYLNSPENAVYHKSRVLYGLYQARQSMRRLRKAIIVEGYMDVISMHQEGLTNVIAASGTAFTPEQARIVSRLSRNVIVLFDGDTAGQTAASRGADNLLTADLSVGVVVLPEGHDPDSYVKKHGPDKLQELIDNAMDVWEFKLRALGDSRPDPAELTKIAAEMADSIALIPDDMKRDSYIDDISFRLHIDRDTMRKAVNGRIRKKSKRLVAREDMPVEKANPTEFYIFASILQYRSLARRCMEEAGSSPFRNVKIRTVIDRMFHRMVEGHDVSPSGLMSEFDDADIHGLIARASVVELDEDTAETNVNELVRLAAENELMEHIARLNRDILRVSDNDEKRVMITKRDELKKRLAKVREQT